MAKVKPEELSGKQLVWHGEFELGNKLIPEVLCTNRKHEFMPELNELFLQVTVVAKANTKEILLIAKQNEDYVKIAEILFELLRYENLLDGRFYVTNRLTLDGADITPIVQEWLPYYKSKKAYTYICLIYDDSDEYKSLFLKWRNMCDELNIIHQMFLYASYSEDITPDVKLALMLQTFEPLADMLYAKGLISLEKQPYITKSIQCIHCNNEVSVQIKNRALFLSDRLQGIMDKYGLGIFDNDNVEELIRKAVNLRNKIVHLDMSNSDTLSGEESGVYIYKFSLLYRNIILSELGLESSGYNLIIEGWVRMLEKQFGHCMIKK